MEFVGGPHGELTAAVAAKGIHLAHLGHKEVRLARATLTKVGGATVRDQGQLQTAYT